MFIRRYLLVICLGLLSVSCGDSETVRKKSPSQSTHVENDSDSRERVTTLDGRDGRQDHVAPTSNRWAPDPTASFVSAKPSPQIKGSNILLAVISGWNSCDATPDESTPNPRGMNIYPHITKLKEQIAETTGKNVSLLASCLTKGIKEHSFYETESSKALRKGDHRFLSEAIMRRAKADQARIVLVGHSYGGWFAMHMAPALNVDNKLAALITVDPISTLRCQAKDVVSPFLGGSSSSGTTGCTSPPQNEAGIDLNETAFHAGSWLNLWQKDLFKVLRSGPVPQASNIEIVHPSLNDAINGHIEMGKNPTTWQTVLEWLRP